MTGVQTCALPISEQLYKGAGRGEEKKQYVIDFLKQKGFKVDEESVINAIEAAVKPVSYTHLDVYKRQSSFRAKTTTAAAPASQSKARR